MPPKELTSKKARSRSMEVGAALRCLRNVEAGEVKSPEGKRDFKYLEDKREASLSRKKLDRRIEEYGRRGAEALGTEGTLREVPEMQPMPNGPVMREGNIDRGEEDGYDEIGGISEENDISNTIKQISNKTPEQLLDDGWKDITHPKLAENTGSKILYNPQTGLKIRFDKGDRNATGFRARDHYHILNNNWTDKKIDYYFDKDGNPVGKGSRASHIIIGDD